MHSQHHASAAARSVNILSCAQLASLFLMLSLSSRSTVALSRVSKYGWFNASFACKRTQPSSIQPMAGAIMCFAELRVSHTLEQHRFRFQQGSEPAPMAFLGEALKVKLSR